MKNQENVNSASKSGPRSILNGCHSEKFMQLSGGHASERLPLQPYLTRKDVCRLLNISFTTLYYYTKDGILPAHRIRGKILYRLSEIESALKPVSTGKSSEPPDDFLNWK